jgi:hypothetical protein
MMTTRLRCLWSFKRFFFIILFIEISDNIQHVTHFLKCSQVGLAGSYNQSQPPSRAGSNPVFPLNPGTFYGGSQATGSGVGLGNFDAYTGSGAGVGLGLGLGGGGGIGLWGAGISAGVGMGLGTANGRILGSGAMGPHARSLAGPATGILTGGSS